MDQKISVRFCGIAGDGIVTTGRILSGACAAIGLHVMVNDIYSAEIRGLGKSTTTTRFSTSKVNSMGDGVDLLVALAAQESIEEIPQVKAGGAVIYDSSGLGDVLVAMGAVCYLFDLAKEAFVQQITGLFQRKGERVLKTNLKAFELGYAYCQENFPINIAFQIDKNLAPKKLITGNDALARGALDAGLKVFAGYPITPATKIMEIAAKELPKLDGWTIQVEDEIAAISAVVGASFAGKRAMTATSGPGLSLMSEMINMAVMAEIPTVIINVQRGGPSTGLPTKVEQGDLNIALYGGSGDSPRIVMAPSDSQECDSGMQVAFDLAEKYQTPVILLSDLFLSQRVETAEIEYAVDRDRCTRKLPSAEQLSQYNRYQMTEDGVSPLIVPGEEGAFYTITGLEHTIKGDPNYEENVHQMMTEKRFCKFESMIADLPKADVIGDEDADIGIATWGSTLGAVLEGMQIARAQGVKSKLIKSIMIHPQHEASFRQFFDSCKKVIVPEMNFQGQYAARLKSRYNIAPVEMHLSSVNPVSPNKIAQKILEVQNELLQQESHS